MNFFRPGCLSRCWGRLSIISTSIIVILLPISHSHQFELNLSLRCTIIALARSQPRSPRHQNIRRHQGRPADFRRPHQSFFGYPPIAVPKLIRIPLAVDCSLDQLIRIRITIITAIAPIRIRINLNMAIMPFLLFACPPVAVLAISDPIPDVFICGLRANKIVQIIAAFMPHYSSGHHTI